jgi:3-hydroxyisobutyrate dehydrogenase-like beta-hydroxyacid dehydrogenase
VSDAREKWNRSTPRLVVPCPDDAPDIWVELTAGDTAIADANLHKMEQGDLAPEFPLEWARKNVDLALAAAGGDRLPMLTTLSQQWRGAVDDGHVSAARAALAGRE